MRAKSWTDEEVELLEKCYKEKMLAPDMVKLFNGKTMDAIKSKAGKLGLPSKYPKNENVDYTKNHKWLKSEEEYLEEAYKNLEKVSDIAQHLNLSEGQVTNKALRMGLTKKYIKPNNANFKAEYQDYDWCYDKFINKCMSAEEIANEYGYTLRVIQKWLYEKHHLDYKRDFKLNDRQKMLIISGCLGDGHIAKDHSVYIESHAENQKDYMFWKYGILENMCNLLEPTYYPPTIKYFNDKPYQCQPSYKITTREVDCLIEIRNMTRLEKINYLDSFGFATHFLDDGYYNGCNWEICLAEWSKEEKDLYIKKLWQLSHANAHYDKDTRYIRLDKSSSEIMNKIILSNIPNDLDIIKYKILKVA